jgi:hypothetical protein
MRIGPQTARVAPLPLGRGREAMTYGRARRVPTKRYMEGAAVSHLAELVRGEFSSRRPPHPPLRGTFSPRGEGSERPAAESP